MKTTLLRILRWAKVVGFAATVAIAGSTASAALGWWLASAEAKPARLDDGPGKKDKKTKSSALGTRGPAALTPEARQQRKDELAEAITDDNLFCPDCKPKPVPGTQPKAGPAVVPTALPLRLVATMQSEDPADSMASIQNTESGRLGVFTPDDVIAEDVRLLEVRRGHVLLAHATPTGGAIEALGFPEKKKPKRKNKRKKKRKKKRRKSKYELPGARKSIDCKKGSCTVKRKFVQGLLANPAKLNRQAKFKSYNRGGKQGYKIYRVRRGTIGRLLGLRNGDLLTAVNGQPLDSLDRVMGMYTRLRRASHLTLTYERKGKVKELELNII